MHVARRQSEMERHSKQRVPKTAAHEHDLHARAPHGGNRLDGSRRERLDVRTRERVDVITPRTDLAQAESIHLLERYPALHCLLGEIGDPARDHVAAAGGEPINSFDAAHGRIDIENEGAKRRLNRLGHATSPWAASSTTKSGSEKWTTVTERMSLISSNLLRSAASTMPSTVIAANASPPCDVRD